MEKAILFRTISNMMKSGADESSFGFKDRAKAEETLKLLEEHEMRYRLLTVRGLLGRAKRTLSITKDSEKIKNIKEAMELFEEWLGENKSEKSKKKERDSDSDDREESAEDKKTNKKDEEKDKKKADTVPGLGFKDKTAAEKTIQILEGRDPDYQRLAVEGLLKSAQRVLTCTKDKTKLKNIEEAMSIFDNFLKDFQRLGLHKEQNSYMPLDVVLASESIALERGVDITEQKKFIEAYSQVSGEYKRLRTTNAGDSTWDIIRNKALKELKEKHKDVKLFNEKDEPTDVHLQMLAWAYSPDAARTKKCLKERLVEKPKKRRSSLECDDIANKKQKD